MGLGRPSAICHPKGLCLIKTWQGQAFKGNTTKLRKNVKPRLQKSANVYKRNPLLGLQHGKDTYFKFISQAMIMDTSEM